MERLIITSKTLRTKAIKALIRKVFAPDRIERIQKPKWRRAMYAWERALQRLLPLGGTSEGNQIQLFNEGDTLLMAMKETIDKAKLCVFLEFYTFEPDNVGTYIRDALTHAAQRGCQVILLYDHLGSPRLNTKFLAPLIKAGGKAYAYNPIWPWRRKGPLLYRDHRKLLIVDNQIAFCGGMNISKDYAGKTLGNSRFQDAAVCIQGPAVNDLSSLFATSVEETTGISPPIPAPMPPFESGVFIQVLASNNHRNLRAIQKGLRLTLARAVTTCHLTTPYFLPLGRLKKSILQASMRGVDVRILTAGLSDVPIMRLASQHVYGHFLKAGIQIYEMHNKTLHAKTAVIDGIYSTIGSFNLDIWSIRRNLEVTVNILDSATGYALEQQFKNDIADSYPILMEQWNNRSIFQRVIQWCAYQLMKI